MKNALLVLAAIVVSCLAFEAALRVAGVSYPVLHRLEAARGWAPWPGADGIYTAEGGARVRFNRAGFRGPEVSRDKPPGVFRVVVLGDSYTEAREVAEDETFVARMGEALAACPALAGPRVEALNFGVSGYGTAQELITLERHALGFAPDLVVLAFYPENDVVNNARALDGHEDRPYFVLEDGRLVPDRETLDSARFALKSAWRNVTNGIVNRSRLLQLVRDTWNKARYALKDESWTKPRFFEPSNADPVFAPPADAAWREAWAVTERLLAEMDAKTRAHGARFALAVLSMPPQVYPEADARAALKARLGLESLFYPGERLAAFGAEHGIPVVRIAERMQEIAARERVFFHGFETTVPGDGHYNARGHAVAGRLIAEGLCESLGSESGG